jgi:ABC-type sugar transport system ATPase subunit
MSRSEPVLTLRAVRKAYGRTTALDGVDFDIRPGEIHALLGQNGSGKSTLMKVAYGEAQPDSGELSLDGSSVRFRTPHDALRHGIAAVAQEVPAALDMTVAENVLMGDLPMRGPLVDWRGAYRRASEILASLGSAIDPRATVRSLLPHERQTVAIAHALARHSKVIILDEPTSSLSVAQAERLFEVMRQLRRRGVGLVFITQRLKEIASVADRVTVLRDGRKVGERGGGESLMDGLEELMTGRTFDSVVHSRVRSDASALLQVSRLADDTVLRGVDLTVSEGEIVGVAGLIGCGRSQLFRALFGAAPFSSGEIIFNGRQLRDLTPRKAIRKRIAFVTGDRRGEGLLFDQSVQENLMLVRRRSMSLRPLRFEAERELAERLVRDLRIRASSLGAPVRSLSGGNQQKVVLGKWLAAEPRLLILDEPTRGVDVAAKADFYGTITSLAGQGLGVLVGSLDTQELLDVCHRILVMYRGAVVADLDAATTNEGDVIRLASGLEVNAA